MGTDCVTLRVLAVGLLLVLPAQAFAFFGGGKKPVPYHSPCAEDVEVSQDPALIRGYGQGANFAAAKLAALKDISERINVRIQSETSTQLQQNNGEVSRAFSSTATLSSDLEVDNATQVCADNKDPSGNWHLVFELDTRPPVHRLGQSLAAALQWPGKVAFSGSERLTRSRLVAELGAAMIGPQSRGAPVTVPLALKRQHGGWYLIAAQEQIRLRNQDLMSALHFPSSPEVLLNILGDQDVSTGLAQLVEGEQFSLRVDSADGGYLSLFNVYADGRVSLLSINARKIAGEPLTFPEAGYTFEAGLLRPGQPTRDVYLAVLTRQPLSDTTVHQLREGRGLVVGEDSYQLDNLFRVLDRADARTASLLVTTLPL